MKFLKNIIRNNKIVLDEEDCKVLLEDITIDKAEEALKKLKEEEEEVRSKLQNNLKEIFNDLPILL